MSTDGAGPGVTTPDPTGVRAGTAAPEGTLSAEDPPAPELPGPGATAAEETAAEDTAAEGAPGGGRRAVTIYDVARLAGVAPSRGS